jgi:hypothetical protein
MSTRAKLIALAIGTAFIGLIVLASWRDREPSYQGEPLSYWIGLYRDTNGPYGRPTTAKLEIASNAVRHIGTNGIPWLVEWVAYDGVGRRNKLRWLPKPLRRVSLLEQLCVDQTKELRAVDAGTALVTLGPEASPAFPELGRILTDADLFGAGTRALWILRKIEEPAVPTLAYAMTNKPSRMRDIIAMNLGHMGPKAMPAVPALKSLLGSTDPGLNSICIQSIEEITGKPFTNAPAQ